MLKLIAEDKDALFILTSGNNPDTYASNDELYKCIKNYVNTDNIYKQSLEDAIVSAMSGDLDTANFVIGSFYTYGTVTDIIKNK